MFSVAQQIVNKGLTDKNVDQAVEVRSYVSTAAVRSSGASSSDVSWRGSLLRYMVGSPSGRAAFFSECLGVRGLIG